MTAGQQRKVLRAIHLAAGITTAVYVYATPGEYFYDVVRFGLIPLLVLTGILLWQAPRLRRLRQARTVDRAPSPPPPERGA
jgi:hypothetical protein